MFACTDDVELLSRMMRMQQKYRDFCVPGFSSNAVLDGAFLKQQDILVIFSFPWSKITGIPGSRRLPCCRADLQCG
ncbi:MAG: hypothetical protein V8T10_01615 [Merdibacter sp.]